MTQKVKLDKTLLATFSDLGKQAFIDGKKAIVHDSKAMDIMKTKAWKVGQGLPYAFNDCSRIKYTQRKKIWTQLISS